MSGIYLNVPTVMIMDALPNIVTAVDIPLKVKLFHSISITIERTDPAKMWIEGGIYNNKK